MNQLSGELEPADPTCESTSTKIRRCAVYARVSSSSRDDTPLSSIEAQIESCKAYVHSQKGVGWELIEPIYADDGYSMKLIARGHYPSRGSAEFGPCRELPARIDR